MLKHINETCKFAAIVLLCSLISCEHVKYKGTSAEKSRLWDKAELSVMPGWLEFKKDSNINPKTIFREFAKDFKLPEGNAMEIVSEEKDELEMTHYRYSQLFKEIPIEHAEFIVHAKNNRALTANGELALEFNPSKVSPEVSQLQAQTIAMHHIPSERYFRGDHLPEEFKMHRAGKLNSDYRPEGKLMYAERPNADSKEWVLAWVFKIYTLPLDRSRQVYINAIDGSLLKELPLFSNYTGCVPGSGDTTFNGNQFFNTVHDEEGTNRFVLANECWRVGHTLWATQSDGTGKNETMLYDDDNNWTGNNRSMVSSFYALNTAYEYFKDVHQRNSYDNRGGSMQIRNDPTVPNASGGSGTINIGLGNPGNDNDDYNSLDIVGHEFGHSLIQQTANLDGTPTKESSALGESFSDIFGILIQGWGNGYQNPNWVIGSPRVCGPCRDFKSPNKFLHPALYNGAYWESPGVDEHINATVQNRWFYLLVNGETGTNNETLIPYTVNGIGFGKAGKIVYRSLTRYLTSSSDYVAAREGSKRAAVDLFGRDSNEVIEVTRAWCAVGLCEYSQPKGPDRFDTKNGNPNPASPDNNNNLEAATPIGTGAIAWSNGRFPNMKLEKLNIFPIHDRDTFRVTLPELDPASRDFLTRPFTTRVMAVSFSKKVTAILSTVDGRTLQFNTETSSFSTPISESQNDLIIYVSAAFPGQVLDYEMEISTHLMPATISELFPVDLEIPKWQLLKDCIACNHEIINDRLEILLEPPGRSKLKVAIKDYYFRHTGESRMLEIPVQLLRGNRLRVDLVNDKGNIIGSTNNIEKTANGNILHLKTEAIDQGIYSLRFSEFGNGTEILVDLTRN